MRLFTHRPSPSAAVAERAVSTTEPTLREVFKDPGVRLLMARDGVSRGDLELLIRSIRHARLASPAPASAQR